jgi:hypothetical protein
MNNSKEMNIAILRALREDALAELEALDYTKRTSASNDVEKHIKLRHMVLSRKAHSLRLLIDKEDMEADKRQEEFESRVSEIMRDDGTLSTGASILIYLIVAAMLVAVVIASTKS